MGRSDTQSLVQSILVMSSNYDLSLAEIVEDGFEIGKIVGCGIIERVSNWIFISKCIS